ncbi:peptidase S9 [Brevibacillus reuszeri]|uniref:Peptidase S9 n=1 Tax=Brevibacillus reuszeri TaxID=54915 RepID=A0A0K9YPF0_9BACL|nr:S9 family peptidase [Brevibacillus reuszeri]KNB70527.1 hypothetical protein ADS79_16550 [Brevibacillus reuszeri]MED1861508.1 S9 family peptidase [Brevibacillus reuszeri]GED70056.1 peptidase S9 [Brevibacillus reuszeri]
MKSPSIDDIIQYRFLSQLKFSPAGGQSAHVVSQADDDNGYRHELWLCSAAGKLLRLAETGRQKLFAWEDADTLLFAAERCEKDRARKDRGEVFTRFYRLCIHSGEAVSAFELGLSVMDIRPVEKGLWLVLGEYNRNHLAVDGLEFNEKEARLDALRKDRDYQIIDEVPFWSNGRGFTNGLRRGHYLYDEAANTLTMVSAPNQEVEMHALSPCGRYIAGAGREMDGVYSEKATLWEYDRASGTTTRLSVGRFHIRGVTYADGDLLFCGAEGAAYGLKENGGFYRVDRASGFIHLLAGYDATIGLPVNSDCRLGGGTILKAQGGHLYFTSLRGYVCGLYRMHLDSGAIEAVYDEAGSIDCFDISGDAIRCISLTGQRLQELYALKDGVLERLSGYNKAAYEDMWHTQPVHHTITDQDGFVFDGWVLLPQDYSPEKRYPAILHIHGGPKTAFGDVYFHEMQVLAAQGYIVLYCNPRGSDGKGDAFADIRGKYGGIDYKNLMQFLDEMLLAYPAIDSARLGVTGGSYGGFMTNWIIGHTNRFRCACSERSISNWFSFTYISDIGYYFGTDQMQADAWKNPQKLWEHSPLRYADKVKTPTLFIHSDEDYRCWIPEGYQMYTALRLHGVEARMCVFHGENHELSRSGKPAQRQRRMAEILQWMNRYLREGGEQNEQE